MVDDAQALRIQELCRKLEQAEELIDAIRSGRVDALVVSGPREDRVFTLKGADHTYRILIETMDQGAVILTPEGTILYCNRCFARMLDMELNQALGVSVADMVAEEDRPAFSVMQARAFSEDAATTEMRLRSRSGELVPVLVSLRALSLPDMHAACMIVTDLTSQKRAEEMLRAYSRKLFTKNEELQRRTEQLARLSAELTMTEQRERRRLSTVLHDGLQQYLASAKMQLGSLIHDTAAEAQRQNLAEIEEMLGASIKMARSLSAELSPPILYERGLAAGLHWLSRWMGEKHDFSVQVSADADVVLTEAVNAFAFEAARELLFNAVKHAGVSWAGVELRPGPDGKGARLWVRDAGKGFDIQALGSTNETGGGFGLFSIRERAGLIGGSLVIESTPGKGSCFQLTLPDMRPPSAPVAVDEPSLIGEALPIEEEQAEALAVIRVLVADDHTLFRDGIARLLNREPDIEVVGHARNGQEAIDLAGKLRPHVILMDVSMPVVNGIEATRVIHSMAPQIRIVGLSMHEDQEHARIMADAGASGFKNKTCSASELLAAVRA